MSKVRINVGVNLFIAIVFFLILSCGVAQARELGHYVPGVANIRDLAVPSKSGFYYEQYNVYYSADTYKDRNGNSVNTLSVGPSTFNVAANVEVYAITPVFLYVTESKILGGDYAFYVAPTFA